VYARSVSDTKSLLQLWLVAQNKCHMPSIVLVGERMSLYVSEVDNDDDDDDEADGCEVDTRRWSDDDVRWVTDELAQRISDTASAADAVEPDTQLECTTASMADDVMVQSGHVPPSQTVKRSVLFFWKLLSTNTLRNH